METVLPLYYIGLLAWPLIIANMAISQPQLVVPIIAMVISTVYFEYFRVTERGNGMVQVSANEPFVVQYTN